MSDRHLAFWPPQQPRHLTPPHTSLYYNAAVSAARYPDKPFLVFYGGVVTFSRFHEEVSKLAGFLQQRCGVQRGDRVLLYMQNSPQAAIAYYAILRADAVVVPVNPMNLTAELRHYVSDTGATTALVAQDLYERMQPLLSAGLQHLIVATYSDYLADDLDCGNPAEQEVVPDFVRAPRQRFEECGSVAWHSALAAGLQPGPLATGPDDLCVMPYTSGTTGHPKGCMHTHRSAMYNTVAGVQWFGTVADTVMLAALPFFHVTGMQGGLNGPLYAGATVILLPRWDRDAAARAIVRHRVNSLHLITTMVIDFLANPALAEYDLGSVTSIRGGGASMPEAVAQKLQDTLGLSYIEGYGMSETIAPTHLNPVYRPKQQCLGMPIHDVDARVVDPITLVELGIDEVGEIIVAGPQVMRGYWNDPAATREAFVELGGKSFLRTGDLGRVDQDGYFFMVDRLKRMINAAGFKIWPAEVEAILYQHPAINEVCIIAQHDPRRGETVKAVVVLHAASRGAVSGQDIIDWSRANMAAYKAPHSVDIVEALPKSGAGKVQWRQLQEQYARQR